MDYSQPDSSDHGVSQTRILEWVAIFFFFELQEGGPLPGPRVGSCLTLRNGLSKETHVLRKQKTLLGKGTQVESRRVREPRRTALPRGSQPRGLW